MSQTTRAPAYFTALALAAALAAPSGAVAQTLGTFDAASDWDKFRKLFKPMSARSEQALTIAADGVTLFLPEKAPAGAVGTQAEAALRGNFHVETKYEVLGLAETVAEAYGPRFGLYVDAGRPVGSASLNRGVWGGGGVSHSQVRLSRAVPAGKGEKYGITGIPTKAKAGKLALRRVGDEVIGLAADAPDGELMEFARLPFTGKPVRVVRLSADAGKGAAALRVRFHDLQVRTGADVPTEPTTKGPAAVQILPMPATPTTAQAVAAGVPTLPDRPDVADPSAADAPPPPEPPLRGQWWILAVAVLGALVVGVLLGRRWLAGPSDPKAAVAEPRAGSAPRPRKP